MSLSSHTVSLRRVAYPWIVPRLWTDTIETHRREVRDAVLTATESLVAEHGLRRVAMSRIAEESGVARATLYKYFPDVESILLAWHEREVGRHLDELEQVRDAAAPEQRLAAVFEAYALARHASREHHDAEFAVLLHRGEHLSHAESHLHTEFLELIRDARERKQIRDDIDPAELAAFCVHALAAAASLPSKAAVRRLVAVTLDGLRG